MNDLKTKYKVATGSITGTFITVERWAITVYPDNDGQFWYWDKNGKVVIVEE